MKKIILIILAIFMFFSLPVILSGCSGNNHVWDEMPTEITKFVARYFPGDGVNKYVETDKGYMVDIKDGASLIFNTDYQWTAVNGNGETLPQVFLFDELPPALYSFLQDNGSVDQVYKVSRDSHDYTLSTLNDTVKYGIATGHITYE